MQDHKLKIQSNYFFFILKYPRPIPIVAIARATGAATHADSPTNITIRAIIPHVVPPTTAAIPTKASSSLFFFF